MEPATRNRTAEERRQEIHAEAARLGIDEAYIATLVDTFYARIRVHPALGPIFAAKIKGDWDPHLAKMKAFWSSVALGTGRYSGQPVPKHMALKNVEEGHFALWLGLFEQTLKDTAPTPGAIPYFMERAERIARSLHLAMFSIPGLRPA